MPSCIIPTMRYRNAPQMIAWLCDNLGFTRHLVIDDGSGGIAHAQLALGQSMIMLGTERDDAFGRHQKSPSTLGATTQSPYIVVPDADVVYARVKNAGATVLIDIQDEDYGGRGFTFRDPEGHVWNIGTYDPWA